MPDPFAGVASPVQSSGDPFAGVATPANATPTPASGSVPALHAGMSDDDIIKAFGYDPNKIKNVRGYQPGMFSKGITDPNGFAAKYILPSIVGGIGHGVSEMKDAYEEAKQHIWGAITGDTSGVDFANLVHAFKNADYNQNWRHRAPGKTGFDPSTLIPQVGLTVLAPEMKPMPAARTLVQGAMVGASSPTNKDGDFAASKVNQIASGVTGAAAGSMVGTGAGKLLGWVGGKAADALAGTKLGNVLGLTQELKPQYAGAPQLAADLQSKGIQTTVGDVTGDPAVRGQEAALARNNPKMMQFRLQQNQQASNYADKVVSDLKQNVADAGWQNLSDVQAAAQSGGKRSGAAQALLTAINNSGDDWKEIAQQSGNLKLFVNKLKADALFDNAQQIADQFGKVPVPATRSAVDSAVSKLAGNTAGDKGAKSFLQGIQDGLSNRDDGGLFKPMQQDTSFAGLRTMRSSIQSRIADITSGKVSASSEELPYLAQISSAIDKDLGNFAGSNGAPLRQAYADASSFYKNSVVPYKEAAFGKALADTDPLKAANLFKGQNAAQQARYFGLLDPKGQAAVRAGLVEDAINAGEKTQRGVMGQTFSAAQAASKLEQLNKNGTMGVAFPGGEDTWAAQGLAKVLRTVDRSDNVGFTPPTGVTAQSIGAKVDGNKTVLGTIAQGVDWLQKDRLMKLYTDPQGKALLQRASDLKVGSAAMGKVIQQISTLLAAQGAAKSTIPLKALIPMAAQNDQLNQPLQITDLRPQVQP